ncbi:MAG: hypothetical protein HQK49_12250 [Oligoflexia bacterium]|nr:hypothetical protein [Oligoflexia bacterium]
MKRKLIPSVFFTTFFLLISFKSIAAISDSSIIDDQIKINNQSYFSLSEQIDREEYLSSFSNSTLDEERNEFVELVDSVLLDILRLREKIINKAQTIDINKNFVNALGTREKFATNVEANLKLKGHSDHFRGNASAKAEAFIIGKKLNLLAGEAQVKAPYNPQDDSTANVNLYVLGFKIYTLEKSSADLIAFDLWSKSLDLSYPILFTIGVIPVQIKFGVLGTVALGFRTDVVPFRSGVTLIPRISANAYTQAGVGVPVFSAGAGTDLLILKDELYLQTKIATLYDKEQDRPYFNAKLKGYNKISTLDGRAFLLVDTYLPSISIIPLEKKTWTLDFIKLKGFTREDPIFEYNRDFYL